MAYIKAIQIFAEFTSEPDARGAFAFLMSQDDCYAGRVYHNEVDCKWLVQTINAPWGRVEDRGRASRVHALRDVPNVAAREDGAGRPMKTEGYLILCRASEYRDAARIAQGYNGKSQAEAKLFVQLKTAALRGSAGEMARTAEQHKEGDLAKASLRPNGYAG